MLQQGSGKQIIMSKTIYMDNAATTFVDKRVLDAMLPYLTDRCFNPSSIYDGAQDVHADLDKARELIAKTLNASARDSLSSILVKIKPLRPIDEK